MVYIWLWLLFVFLLIYFLLLLDSKASPFMVFLVVLLIAFVIPALIIILIERC